MTFHGGTRDRLSQCKFINVLQFFFIMPALMVYNHYTLFYIVLDKTTKSRNVVDFISVQTDKTVIILAINWHCGIP